ncbi:MAG TPA: FAD-dependent monooxygenase [Thermomicrobiales bacterium]|nr:FAD-dependent monooxygenase [Thermomicrobiales bacterium]
MRIRGSTIGIVGGSIAGCAAAIALGRLGCDVHVFERSSGALRDRGSGIVMPPALRDDLIGSEYLPAGFPTCPLTSRSWIVADGTPAGRRLWRQPGSGAATNWGVLWRSLRAAVPDDRYHDGVPIAAFRADGDGATVLFAGGSSRSFDVLVGADGYRSLVRSHLSTQTRPDYAGYVAWRGNYPEERLARRAVIDRGDEERAWFTVCFDGGHGIVYAVPNFDDRTDPGHRRVNWLVYTPPPPGMDFAKPTSIPPGAVSTKLYRHLDRLFTTAFPADFQAVIRASPVDEVSIQPIYDQRVDSYVRDRVVVTGDADAVCRPHTASGTAKALQDALSLERLGREHDAWADLLSAYDAERSAAGAVLVELGRRIGRDQVERTPSWATLTADDVDAWARATLAGERLYFYGDAAG